MLQPVLVRAAERRLRAHRRRTALRAARRAGLRVPGTGQARTTTRSLEQALVENLHREDLNPLEEAAAYQQLIEDFGLTHEEVAKQVGKSRTSVTNALRLFQLPATVQRHIRDGLLTAGHGRTLLGTPDRARQEELAHEAVRGGLSVRTLEEMVRASGWPEDTPAPGAQEADAPEIGPSAANGRQPAGPARPLTRRGRPLQARTEGMQPPWRKQRTTWRRATSRAFWPPGVLDLEELLGDHLNTRVTVDVGGKRGRVIIKFANLDDLERIYRVMIGEA